MKRLSKRDSNRLQRLLPKGEVYTDAATCQRYARDKWFAVARPEAVVLARSTRSVTQLLGFASRRGIPVTPRGSGYGYVGGCVPVRGGIVLSLERMKRLKEINREDLVAVVQPGITTQRLQEAVEREGLFYPPDPASRADCSLGGNIATNAGGPRCLKYGVTRDYVLGLKAVLAEGSVVCLGGRTHKNKTGFDLHRLFVGSEGLLGVVTEATLKLLPLPPYRACLSVGFKSMKTAAQAIRAIFGAGYLPSAVEVADRFTLEACARRTRSRLFAGCQAHLIVECDGQEGSVRSDLRGLGRLLSAYDPVFLRRGMGAKGCEKIWRLRREFSYSLRDTGLTKLNQDIVVPRGRLEALFRFAARLQKKHGMPVACFGHAGDGNIHVNLMLDPTKAEHEACRTKALNELFSQVLKWKGAITGEHGIGLARLPWWQDAMGANERRLHQCVKRALDPNGILNPGKFV